MVLAGPRQVQLLAGDCGDYKVLSSDFLYFTEASIIFLHTSRIYATFVLRKMIDNAYHCEVGPAYIGSLSTSTPPLCSQLISRRVLDWDLDGCAHHKACIVALGPLRPS